VCSSDLDCKTQNADEILSAVITSFEQRDKLKLDVEAGCIFANQKLGLYDTVLQEFLENIASAKR